MKVGAYTHTLLQWNRSVNNPIWIQQTPGSNHKRLLRLQWHCGSPTQMSTHIRSMGFVSTSCLGDKKDAHAHTQHRYTSPTCRKRITGHCWTRTLRMRRENKTSYSSLWKRASKRSWKGGSLQARVRTIFLPTRYQAWKLIFQVKHTFIQQLVQKFFHRITDHQVVLARKEEVNAASPRRGTDCSQPSSCPIS